MAQCLRFEQRSLGASPSVLAATPAPNEGFYNRWGSSRSPQDAPLCDNDLRQFLNETRLRLLVQRVGYEPTLIILLGLPLILGYRCMC